MLVENIKRVRKKDEEVVKVIEEIKKQESRHWGEISGK